MCVLCIITMQSSDHIDNSSTMDLCIAAASSGGFNGMSANVCFV